MGCLKLDHVEALIENNTVVCIPDWVIDVFLLPIASGSLLQRESQRGVKAGKGSKAGRESVCTVRGTLLLYLAENSRAGLIMETRVQITR